MASSRPCWRPCVIAIASWPLYVAFRARLPRSVGRSAGAAIFTVAITVFVLGPHRRLGVLRLAGVVVGPMVLSLVRELLGAAGARGGS